MTSLLFTLALVRLETPSQVFDRAEKAVASLRNYQLNTTVESNLIGAKSVLTAEWRVKSPTKAQVVIAEPLQKGRDATLRRLTLAKGRLAGKTWRELRALRVRGTAAALDALPMIGQHPQSCQLLNESGLRAHGCDPNYVFRSNDNGTVAAPRAPIVSSRTERSSTSPAK